MSDLAEQLPDVPTLLAELDEVSYLADEPLGTALFLAARMSQPILLEGEPGVGKTEAAKALAAVLDTPLIRLQCYEGLTSAEALYEWNYPRQLLAIRLAEASGEAPREADLFSDDYLLERPLLAALDHPGPRPAVLLIDEVDRGDDEFEAFLFELLAESAVTIPELGTRRAAYPPVVVLTSNRTRDLHDALKRRCLYHWIDYPDAGPGRGDHPAPGAGRQRAAGLAGGGRRAPAARARPGQAAGRRRGDQLGERAAGPRRRRAGRGRGPQDHGHGAQVRRGPAERARGRLRRGRRATAPAMPDRPASRTDAVNLGPGPMLVTSPR